MKLEVELLNCSSSKMWLLLAYIECWIVSNAVSEGKKSSTATSLFSFFLSVHSLKENTISRMKLSNYQSIYRYVKSQLQPRNQRKDTFFKEAADFSKAVWGKLFDVSVVFVLWIISTNCNDLVVFLSLNSKLQHSKHVNIKFIR